MRKRVVYENYSFEIIVLFKLQNADKGKLSRRIEQWSIYNIVHKINQWAC